MRNTDRIFRDLGLAAGRDWMRDGHDGDDHLLEHVLMAEITGDLRERVQMTPDMLERFRAAGRDGIERADEEFWGAFIGAVRGHVTQAIGGSGSN